MRAPPHRPFPFAYKLLTSPRSHSLPSSPPPDTVGRVSQARDHRSVPWRSPLPWSPYSRPQVRSPFEDRLVLPVQARRTSRSASRRLAALGAAFAPDADAARGPCLAGKKRPLCYHWKARVTAVLDGDTIDGQRARRWPLGAVRRVRLTGINAMEQTRYSRNPSARRGYCHSLAATARLQRLIRLGSRRVRLSAQNPSSRSGPRLRRAVAIRSSGRWVDLGQILIDEGHVQFNPNPIEWAHNGRYSRGAQRAARAGRNLWDTNYCGNGPARASGSGCGSTGTADGTAGRRSVNGEWVRSRTWELRSSRSAAGGSATRCREPSGSPVARSSRPSGRSRSTWAAVPAGIRTGRRTSTGASETRSSRTSSGRRASETAATSSTARAISGSGCCTRAASPVATRSGARSALGAAPRPGEGARCGTSPPTSVDLEGYVVDNFPYNYSFPARTVPQAARDASAHRQGLAAAKLAARPVLGQAEVHPERPRRPRDPAHAASITDRLLLLGANTLLTADPAGYPVRGNLNEGFASNHF